MVKKILSIVLWVLTAATLVVLFVFGRKQYLETPLQGVVFNLERSHAEGFVEKDSVLTQVERMCDMEHRAALSTVDLIRIRKMLDSSPWIECSSAYIGLNDTLIINAKEYEPVVRVFNHGKRSIYLTAEGVVIPANPHYTPRIIIASGNYAFDMPGKDARVNDTVYSHSGLAETLAIVKAIQNDRIMNGNIGQVYRNNDNQFEIIANGLPARVIVGDTCNIAQKLTRLGKLIEKYGGTEEINTYKTLDLQYKNQIVCTK